MKSEFFKDSTNLYNLILGLLIITLSLVFIIIYIKLITILGLSKVFQAKIILTSDGIEEKLYKKQIRFIMWEEIGTAYIIKRSSRYITLIIRETNEKLEFNINERRLTAMRELCSDKELKKKLFNIKLSIFNQKYGIW